MTSLPFEETAPSFAQSALPLLQSVLVSLLSHHLPSLLVSCTYRGIMMARMPCSCSRCTSRLTIS